MNQLKRTAFIRKTPDNTIKPSPGARKKKCANRACRESFVPSSPFISHCSPDCAVIIALDRVAKKKSKEAKAERAADKLKLKKKSDYAADAQAAVNKYVKWRDWGKECVSCGRRHIFDVTRNASHLYSRGSNSALRFHLWNIHMSCIQCNKDKGGNAAEYYPLLCERIGQDKVEFIRNTNRSRKYTTEYLIRIKNIFNRKAKRQENRIK